MTANPQAYLDRRQNRRQRLAVKVAMDIRKDFGTLSAARFMRMMEVPEHVALRLLTRKIKSRSQSS